MLKFDQWVKTDETCPLQVSCRPFLATGRLSILYNKVSPEPSLVQAEQPQISEPVFIGIVLSRKNTSQKLYAHFAFSPGNLVMTFLRVMRKYYKINLRRNQKRSGLPRLLILDSCHVSIVEFGGISFPSPKAHCSPFDVKLNVFLLAVWHLKIGSTASRVITAVV